MAQANRFWQCRGRSVPLNRTLLMGIVNATPDSFFSASRTAALEAAVARALQLEAEGADVLDIGGESTRPGSEPPSIAAEIDRVCPVIEAVAARSDVLISVDTRHAAVAAAALEAGAHIINDVQGTIPEPAMPALIAASGAGYVLMHMRGTPQTMGMLTDYPDGDVIGAVLRDFESARLALVAAGCTAEQIVLDPGLGFAKTAADSLRLLGAVQIFDAIAPVLIGASRKRFIGAFTQEDDPAGRLPGSLGAALRAAADGAAVVRVHDVKATRDALRIFCGAASSEGWAC